MLFEGVVKRCKSFLLVCTSIPELVEIKLPSRVDISQLSRMDRNDQLTPQVAIPMSLFPASPPLICASLPPSSAALL